MITRFAPSPTGYLHLGHAYAAWFAWKAARTGAGRFLLRWEDIDTTRCRADYEAAIEEDLDWLGLRPDDPHRMRQSERFASYQAAIDQLHGHELLYPCFCTRREIQEEIQRAGQAPHGPDGPLYPGLCRSRSKEERHDRLAAGEPHAWRLKMDAALRVAGTLAWHDREAGEQSAQPELFGDVVLARKDTPTSYHLAVTVDDAAQGITLVTRGEDLFPATHIHRLLQALLDLPVPASHHHRLIRDARGVRLAKRDAATTLQDWRARGITPNEVRQHLGIEQGD